MKKKSPEITYIYTGNKETNTVRTPTHSLGIHLRFIAHHVNEPRDWDFSAVNHSGSHSFRSHKVSFGFSKGRLEILLHAKG
jgi:hypothetical protein